MNAHLHANCDSRRYPFNSLDRAHLACKGDSQPQICALGSDKRHLAVKDALQRDRDEIDHPAPALRLHMNRANRRQREGCG